MHSVTVKWQGKGRNRRNVLILPPVLSLNHNRESLIVCYKSRSAMDIELKLPLMPAWSTFGFECLLPQPTTLQCLPQQRHIKSVIVGDLRHFLPSCVQYNLMLKLQQTGGGGGGGECPWNALTIKHGIRHTEGRKKEGTNGRKEDKLSSFRFLSRGLNVYFPRDLGGGRDSDVSWRTTEFLDFEERERPWQMSSSRSTILGKETRGP